MARGAVMDISRLTHEALLGVGSILLRTEAACRAERITSGDRDSINIFAALLYLDQLGTLAAAAPQAEGWISLDLTDDRAALVEARFAAAIAFLTAINSELPTPAPG